MKKSFWLFLLVAGLSLAASVRAQNTWLNSPDGDFRWTSVNWTAPTTWAGGDDAIFGPNGVGPVSISSPVTAHNLTFNSPGYAITNGTLTLNGATPTITVNENASISSIITGGSGLTLLGLSSLTLLGANTYTDGTYVRSGTLILRSAGVNGSTTYSVERIQSIDPGARVEIGTLNDGSDLDGATSNIRPPDGQLQRGGSTGRLNLTGGTFDNKGDNNGINYPPPEGTGTIINSSPYQRAVLKISKSDGATYVFNGQIMDGGVTISKTNGGPGYQQSVDMNGGNFKMIWGGSNSFSGFIRMNSGPTGNTIILTNQGTLGYPAPINCPARHILMNSGTIDLNGTSQKVGYVYTGNDANSKIVNSTLGTVSTLTVGFNCTNLVPFNGAATPRGIRSALLDDPTTGGTLALTKEGVCIQPLGNYSGDGTPAPNNYHGDTTVNNGILQVLSLGGISPNSHYRLNTTSGTLQLSYSGIAPVKALSINGVALVNGVYGSSTAPITGPGFVRVTGNPALRITEVNYDVGADGLVLRWDSVPGAIYAIQNSQNLVDWDSLTTGISSGGVTTTNKIDFPQPGTFYRIRKD